QVTTPKWQHPKLDQSGPEAQSAKGSLPKAHGTWQWCSGKLTRHFLAVVFQPLSASLSDLSFRRQWGGGSSVGTDDLSPSERAAAQRSLRFCNVQCRQPHTAMARALSSREVAKGKSCLLNLWASRPYSPRRSRPLVLKMPLRCKLRRFPRP